MNYWYDQSCRITSSISVSMFHEMYHLKFILLNPQVKLIGEHLFVALDW